MSALDEQVGGNHYLGMQFQPAHAAQEAGLGWCEANVIKYVSRHQNKNGAQDLDKAAHYFRMLAELAAAGKARPLSAKKRLRATEVMLRFISQTRSDGSPMFSGLEGALMLNAATWSRKSMKQGLCSWAGRSLDGLKEERYGK